MTGEELASALSAAVKAANKYNNEASSPYIRLRLAEDGIVANVNHRNVHFTRTIKYKTILAGPYTAGIIELELAEAVAEIRKCGR